MQQWSGGSHREAALPRCAHLTWDVHIPHEMFFYRFGLELTSSLVCPRCCAGCGSWVWPLCGAWCCGDGLQSWGLSHVPSLPHDVELCLVAWERRRTLDRSEIDGLESWIYLDNTASSLAATAFALEVSDCVWWCPQFGAGPSRHHEHSQLVDSPCPEGSVCLETNLAGCHSSSQLPAESVTRGGIATMRDLTNPGKKGVRSVCERKGPAFVGFGPTAFKGNRLTLI